MLMDALYGTGEYFTCVIIWSGSFCSADFSFPAELPARDKGNICSQRMDVKGGSYSREQRKVIDPQARSR